MVRGAEADVATKEAGAVEADANAAVAQEAVKKQKREQDAADFEKQLGPELAALMGEASEGEAEPNPNGSAKPARRAPAKMDA